MIFSIPTSVTSTRGSVTHIRPLPSDSTTQIAAGVGEREVGAAEPDLDAQELLAQELPRGAREVLRLVAQLAELHRPLEQLADLDAVAVQRRHDDVRRPVLPSWMIRSARSVSNGVMPAASSAALSRVSSEVIVLTLMTSRSPCAG